MAILVITCPHCGVRNNSFHINSSHQNPKNPSNWNVFASCPVCFGPITAFCFSDGQNPKDAHGELRDWPRLRSPAPEIFPKRRASVSPADVPEAAADAFVEGAENAKDGRYSSAVMMFRRAIDVGTKQFAPEIDVFNLGKRIDKLATNGLITKDLKEWAHKIRLEGNEAVHEMEKPTKEQTGELQTFTELILTYLFTLPAKVRANLPPEE